MAAELCDFPWMRRRSSVEKSRKHRAREEETFANLLPRRGCNTLDVGEEAREAVGEKLFG